MRRNISAQMALLRVGETAKQYIFQCQNSALGHAVFKSSMQKFVNKAGNKGVFLGGMHPFAKVNFALSKEPEKFFTTAIAKNFFYPDRFNFSI
ncbi:hypothetical protein A2783_02065 [Microgenomates group bacterium RIFCSPHIGHO2_01_FULL_45_11]|nr:MAG: hypothetical protein A2783_02065 [Microgenomates group bacterium RIFCSPHIGHO2_01_FULL_45_11]